MVKQAGGRSYRQYCGLARALDVVGDRWNLLIVRQLLLGPARYGELAAALPGAASNLLAARLRALEEAGVVERRRAPDRNGVRYGLTAWGSELRHAIDALVRWSAPLMASGPGEDSFRPEWLAIALPALLHGRRVEPPVAIGFETAGSTVVLRLDEGGPHVEVGGEPPPTVLRAEPGVVLALAAGAMGVDQAVASGALRGDRRDLDRAFPAAGLRRSAEEPVADPDLDLAEP